jgi:hypothetical protein
VRPLLTTLLTSIVLFMVWVACDVVCYIRFPHLKRYEFVFTVIGAVVACVPVLLEFFLPKETRSFVRGFVVSGVSLFIGLILIVFIGIGLHLSMGGSL